MFKVKRDFFQNVEKVFAFERHKKVAAFRIVICSKKSTNSVRKKFD